MDPVKRWSRIAKRAMHDCRVFELGEVTYRHPESGEPRSFFVVDAPDWINVVPLTPEGRVVMIRQFRFGTDDITLEIPGGMCDPGESPAAAAARELREETGYGSDVVESIGWVHPNPAVQSNRCHSFVARNVRPEGPPEPDPNEAFEIVLRDLDEIPGLIAEGAITHSLVIAAFHLLGLRG